MRTTSVNKVTVGKAAASVRRSSVKRQRSTVADSNAGETKTVAPIELSAKVQRLTDAIRADFKAYTSDLAAVTVTRATLAPPFVAAFNAFAKQTSLGLADFCRQLDPTVPVEQKEYRKHRAYVAADYLRRLVAQAKRPKRAKADRPASPLDGMSRLIAALLPTVAADQLTRLWETIAKELRWTDAQIAGLKKRVETADPLMNVRPPRGAGGAVPQLRVLAPRHSQAAEEDEPRTGTHG